MSTVVQDLFMIRRGPNGPYLSPVEDARVEYLTPWLLSSGERAGFIAARLAIVYRRGKKQEDGCLAFVTSHAAGYEAWEEWTPEFKAGGIETEAILHIAAGLEQDQVRMLLQAIRELVVGMAAGLYSS